MKPVFCILIFTAFLIGFTGCNREEEPNENPAFAHAIRFPTEYYLGGPQQARPPDGQLLSGTRVNVVEDAGSYVLVESNTGIRAYIARDSLDPPLK